MIEAALRRVALRASAHVPLADMRGFVADALQILRKENQLGTDRMIVVDDPMLMRIQTGQDRRARRRAQRRRHKRIAKVRAIAGQPVEIRSLRKAGACS